MAGSFPCCLPQISLGVGALPVFVPSDSCPLFPILLETSPLSPKNLSSLEWNCIITQDSLAWAAGCGAGTYRMKLGRWRQMETGGRFDYLLLPKADPPSNNVRAHY